MTSFTTPPKGKTGASGPQRARIVARRLRLVNDPGATLFPSNAGRSAPAVADRPGRGADARGSRADGRCQRPGVPPPGPPLWRGFGVFGDGLLRRDRAPERANARIPARGRGRASAGDPDLRFRAAGDGRGGPHGRSRGRRSGRHQLWLPGAEGDEDRRRRHGARASCPGRADRRRRGRGGLRPRLGEDAPRAGRPLAGGARARPATRRGRCTDAHAPSAERTPDVHRNGRPLAHRGARLARRRSRDRLGGHHFPRARAVLATTRAAAVMVGRAAQGNPWALREILDSGPDDPSPEEVVAELVLFVRETVRELGERRATGFLKKFYGWYLGRGRFPKAFKQELLALPTLSEVEDRLFAEVPGARFVLQRLEAEQPIVDEVLLDDMPISIFGGG